ncbi:hypothetical protein L5M36_19635 [Shewanella sp. SM72]|uniref:hypothetical protein n=1 Tax=Shewanella TaxID=22 RepID=UPI0021DAEE45|nr:MULTISPECIES: hypothetical protein [unclassified Shewanella]MCU8019077.1 hypothetical protein [Shewanella sp. SM72]MCU8031701.1 hypothetical protein [Shewanella sp. SM73]
MLKIIQFLFVSVFVFIFGGIAYVINPVAGLIVGGGIFYLFFLKPTMDEGKVHNTWQQHQTFDEYIKINPNKKTSHGMKCSQCNSSSIRSWGIDGPSDKRRVHICNHCNKELYRTS